MSHLRSGRVIQRSRGQKRTSDVDTEEDDGLGATRARRRTRKAKVSQAGSVLCLWLCGGYIRVLGLMGCADCLGHSDISFAH